MSRRAVHKARHSQQPSEEEARKKQVQRPKRSMEASESPDLTGCSPLASQSVSGSKLPSNSNPMSQAAMLQAQQTMGNSALQRLMAPAGSQVMRQEKEKTAAPQGEQKGEGKKEEDPAEKLKSEAYNQVKSVLEGAGVNSEAAQIAHKAGQLLLGQVRGTKTWKELNSKLKLDKALLKQDIDKATRLLMGNPAVKKIAADVIKNGGGNLSELVKGVLSESAKSIIPDLQVLQDILGLEGGLEGDDKFNLSARVTDLLKGSLTFGVQVSQAEEPVKKQLSLSASANMQSGTGNIAALWQPVDGLEMAAGVKFTNSNISGNLTIQINGKNYQVEAIGNINQAGDISLRAGGKYYMVDYLSLTGQLDYMESPTSRSMGGSGGIRFIPNNYIFLNVSGSGRRVQQFGAEPNIHNEFTIVGTVGFTFDNATAK